MEYTILGKTGAKVSRIGFGGAVAGLKNYLYSYDPEDEKNRKAVCEALEMALEKGITYFDTAPGYGNGLSETLFGEVLGGVNPSQAFIATKCPSQSKTPDMDDYEAVMRSVEGSLKRLKRDTLDLVQLHGLSYSAEEAKRVVDSRGALEALEQLKKDGVVRFIGFTTEDNNRAVYDFIDSGRFDVIQLCYNFLFQHPYEPSRPFGSLFEAEKRNLGIAAMRVTTSGTFQRWMKQIRPDDDFDYTEALIQFVLSNKLVDVALIGMRNVRRVIQNVEIAENQRGRIDVDAIHTRYV